MNWKIKVLFHWLISYLPFGHDVHYWLQRHVTKKLPGSEPRFREKAKVAQKHIENFRSYSGVELDRAVFFEIGTGWDLPIQLLFYAYGVNNQITIDVKRLVRPELVNHSISRIQRLELPGGRRLPKRLLDGNIDEQLREFYGITYLAPCTVTMAGLENESIDFVTSSDTMQHIPRDELIQLAAECHRILRPGGVMSIQIGNEDHYSYFDTNLPRFNFLKYSDLRWSLFCPPSHFQNRLRHVDYHSIFTEGGFRMLEENRVEGSQEDLLFARSSLIDKRFAENYSPADLVVSWSQLVFRKK